VDDGVVPANCYFWGFYGIGEHSGVTDGFYLRLRIDKPDSAYGLGIVLPVLDVAWGRVPISLTKVASLNE